MYVRDMPFGMPFGMPLTVLVGNGSNPLSKRGYARARAE